MASVLLRTQGNDRGEAIWLSGSRLRLQEAIPVAKQSPSSQQENFELEMD